jgi:predicted RNase H-like nuclease (RuvC/YqgF family)
MKNCKNCGIEFQPKHETRGQEQIYCSVKCRMAAYKKRVNENQQTSNIGNMERQNFELPQQTSNSNTYVYSLLEKLGEAKAEIVRHQLRADHLQNEIEHLKSEIAKKQIEIDEILEEDKEENDNPFISGILSNLQKDPMGTWQMLNTFLNPNHKTNAQTTTATREV